MEEKDKNLYEEKVIAKVDLDFESLDEWRKEEADDIPICSLISFYKACGITKYIEEYKEKEGKSIVSLDNLACNFKTLQRIKDLIETNWSEYSLDIDKDNHVFWDTRTYEKNERHYAKKLNSRVQNSINQDFLNFCPGVDDELEDNILVFRTYYKSEEKED